jgi:hypothetical protein
MMKYLLRSALPLVIFCTLFTACETAGQSSTVSPGSSSGQVGGTVSQKHIPSTMINLTGLVKHPGVLKLADLQTFPKVSVSVHVQPLGAHTFAGALLYAVLQKAQVITQSGRKNDILRKSVLVEGTDGYTVAVAWGELDPQLAQKQILLAYEEDGKPLPQADGFVRLIVPGDLLAGRSVSNVDALLVRDAGVIPTTGPRQPSTAFYLVGAVKVPVKYDPASLSVLKTTTLTVQGTSYSGVLLNDLLQRAGLQLALKKNAFLHLGIVAIGSDGYSCIFVDGEINPRFGNVPILIALTSKGQPLSSADGFARVVVPGDQKMGRFVSNLVELQVVELASAT